MKVCKFFRIFILFFVFMFVSGCVKDSQKVSAIAPSIEECDNFTITNYLGKDVSYALKEEEVKYVKQEMPYFYEARYYTADTTRTPLVRLTVMHNQDKIDFVCALDNNENQCYMLYINAVSYNIRVKDEFEEEHNFFSYLYGIAGINIEPFM